MFARFKSLARDEDAGLSVGKVIGVVILVVIALAMLPLVTDAVTDAEGNTTGTAQTLVGMVTLFYILGVVLACVVWVIHETKGFGST